MPRRNTIDARTARALERMEAQIGVLKLEWKTSAQRTASSGPMTADGLLSGEAIVLLQRSAAIVGVLRGCQDLLRSTRAIVSGRRMLLVIDEEAAE